MSSPFLGSLQSAWDNWGPWLLIPPVLAAGIGTNLYMDRMATPTKVVAVSLHDASWRCPTQTAWRVDVDPDTGEMTDGKPTGAGYYQCGDNLTTVPLYEEVPVTQ